MGNIFRTHQVRLQIGRGFGVPQQSPVTRDILASTLFHNAAKAPGSRGGVRRYVLDNVVAGTELEREESGKVPALGPGIQIGATDNDPADWQQFHDADEAALLAAASARLNAEAASIRGRASGDNPRELTDDETKR